MTRWIFEEYDVDDRSLAIYRIVYALVTFVYLPSIRWVSELPDAFFLPPPGIMRLFDGFPSAAAIGFMDVALRLLLACILLGFATRPASILFSVLLTIYIGFAYSVEKVHHHYLICFLPLALSASRWGCRYSLDALLRRRPARGANGWALALLAVAIGVFFASSAQEKWLGGWLDIETQAAQAHVVSRALADQNRGWASLLAMSDRADALAEAVDWSTVLFEAAILFACVRRRYFRIAIALAVYLHVGILLFMGVNFFDQVLVYGAFVDWASCRRKLLALPALRALLWLSPPLLLALVAWFVSGLPLSILAVGWTAATYFLTLQLRHWWIVLRRTD